MQKNKPSSINFFGAALLTYGTVDKVIQLQIENNIENIKDADNEFLVLNFQEEEAIAILDSPITTTIEEQIEFFYISEQRQSVFNLSLMSYGSLDSHIDLCVKNGIFDPTSNPASRTKIFYDRGLVLEEDIYREVQRNKYVFNTSEPKVISGKSFNKDFDKSFL